MRETQSRRNTGGSTFFPFVNTHFLDLNCSIFSDQHRARFNWRIELKKGHAMANLTINGKTIDVDVEDDTPLLWAIRENVGLTGTKYGCGIALCGACTVHVDGVAMRSCGISVSDAVGKQITTIEGLAGNGALHKVQQAWVANDVPQCGYCQSGMIMAVAALLNEKPKPTDQDIDEAITNICRCGTFQQVREAIHAAANA
jgi:isoquinoline 1-oxidoreductase alpha subunit